MIPSLSEVDDADISLEEINGRQHIADAFATCKRENRPAFIPYLTGGYPITDDTVPLLLALEESGADIIEIGVPFSDPLADGGTIQLANQVALENGVRTEDCLEFVKEARELGLQVPVIMMGYYNPFLAYGESKLVENAKKAGVSGFIVVDLPPEEAETFKAECDKASLAFVPLVAPTTTDDRLRRIAAFASGYVYCVSVTGITGARSELPLDLSTFMGRVGDAFGDIPKAVGFGLSTREHVAAVGRVAEGAVIGSAIIRQISSGDCTLDRVRRVAAFCESVLPPRKAQGNN